MTHQYARHRGSGGRTALRRERRERIERHERALIARAAAALRGMDGVTVYAARDAAEQVGVLSFNLDGREPEKTADALAQRGFARAAGCTARPTPTARRERCERNGAPERIHLHLGGGYRRLCPCAAEHRARLKAALAQIHGKFMLFRLLFLRIILEYE